MLISSHWQQHESKESWSRVLGMQFSVKMRILQCITRQIPSRLPNNQKLTSMPVTIFICLDTFALSWNKLKNTFYRQFILFEGGWPSMYIYIYIYLYAMVQNLYLIVCYIWRKPTDHKRPTKIHHTTPLNPLRAKFFRGNVNIYLHFVSLLHIDVAQVLKILSQVRSGITYST